MKYSFAEPNGKNKIHDFYRVFRPRFVSGSRAAREMALANTKRETSPAGPPEDRKLAIENPSSVTAAAAEQGYNIQKHAPHVDDRMKMFTSIGS